MSYLASLLKQNNITLLEWEKFLQDKDRVQIGLMHPIFKHRLAISGDGEYLFRITPQQDPLNTLEVGWIAIANKASQAISNGMISPDQPSLSLLGKMISHLGRYPMISLKRKAFGGCIDWQAEVKDQLCLTMIGLIKAMRPLEYMINRYDPMETKENNAARLSEAASLSKKKVTKRINQLLTWQREFVPSHSLKDEKWLAKVLSFCRDLEFKLNDYATNSKMVFASHDIHHVQSRFKAVGENSVGAYLEHWVYEILSLGEEINQNLTTLRGDFHTCIQEAKQALKHHQPDWHNPVSLVQQGYFVKQDKNLLEQETQDYVVLLASEWGMKESDAWIDFALMAASLSEKSKGQELIATEYLVQSQAAKWHMRSERGLMKPKVKSTVMALWDSCVSTVGCVPNLMKGLILGDCQPVLKNWRSEPPKIAGEDPVANFKQFLTSLAYNTKPLGLGAGIALHEVFKNIAKSSFSGLTTGLGHLLEQMVSGLTGDLRYGWLKSYQAQYRLEKDVEAVFKSTETQVVSESKTSLNPAYYASYSTMDPVFPENAVSLRWVRPELKARSGVYESQGLLPAISRGLDSFYGFFDRHLFNTHTFTTLVFFGVYGVTGLAAFSPSLFQSYFGSGRFVRGLVDISVSIGSAFANGAFSQAIAAGFTLAKVAAGVLEGILHGTDSWIYNAVRAVKKDFSRYAAYTALAVGFGWLVAEKLSLPWLSKHLKEDAGSVPFLAYGFAGLKIAVLLAESLVSKDHSEKVKIKPHNFLDHAEALITESRGEDGCLSVEEALLLQAISPSKLLNTDLAFNTHRKSNAAEQFGEAIGEREVAGNIFKLDHSKYEGTGMRVPLSRLKILVYLTSFQNALSKRSMAERRDMVELLDRYFDPQSSLALKQVIYPEPKRSLVGEMIHTLLAYPGALLRIMLIPISGSLRPLKELGSMLKKDGTANLTAVWNIGATLLAMGERFISVSSDFIVNELLARMEYGLLGTHGIADGFYRLTRLCHQRWVNWGQKIYVPIYKLQQSQTRPDLNDLIQQLWRENTYEMLRVALSYEVSQPSIADSRVSESSKIYNLLSALGGRDIAAIDLPRLRPQENRDKLAPDLEAAQENRAFACLWACQSSMANGLECLETSVRGCIEGPGAAGAAAVRCVEDTVSNCV